MIVSEELKKIINKIVGQGRTYFSNGATGEQIANFENEHKIALPLKFKEWLLYADGGEIFLPAGIQLYGVAHKPFIDVHDNDRPDDNYVVIGALASGDTILFKKASEQISIYNHSAGVIESDETYTDFYAFLNDLYELLGIGS